MAQIVGGFGVPHTPIFPHFVKRDGQDCEIAKLFGAQKEQLAATRPDVIVMFDTDHLNTFFLDSLPVFALGVDKTFRAPNDEPRDVPNYVVPSAPDLAAHIRQAGIDAGFDVGMTQNFSVDHSVTVPLHFLTPGMNIPVVPFFISAHVPPLPSSQRCYALGQAVGRAIEAWPENKRVVVMGSGSFSLEVGGPRMGQVDQEWVDFCVKTSREGDTAALVKAATPQRMWAAGNTAGEVLNWIAMMGAVGDKPAKFVDPDSQPPEAPRDAHAYAVWEVAP